jgi:cytochrome c-type biogenesis protein CcmH/NrfG
MLTLYVALTIMLVLSIGIVSIPFIKNKSIIGFISVSLVFVISACTLYQFSGNKPALQNWFTHGEEHYRLQVQINKMGGIDAIIKRVQAKLEANPNDAQGWMILGKLYLGKQDTKSANAAFQRAKELDI